MKRTDFNLQQAVRPNIWALKPYRCARDDYSTGILLDANENSYGSSLPLNLITTHLQPSLKTHPLQDSITYTDSNLNRYPDPYQQDIKQQLCKLRNISSPDCFFLGVGSDESIDLAFRVFCTPGKEKCLITPPTYGMYSVSAQTNDVGVVKVPLVLEEGKFQLRVDDMLEELDNDPSIKLTFICSPGNPTGTLIAKRDIKRILDHENYKGIVIVDEAYIDFSEDSDDYGSVATWVEEYPNLIVIQTLSKAFGMAGIRLGIAVSSPEIAGLFNKTKAPYNISTPTSLLARAALSEPGIAAMQSYKSQILAERGKLISTLSNTTGIGCILGGNNANFLLAQVVDLDATPSNFIAHAVYKMMAEELGVVVRFRGSEIGCEGCLRITVGTEEENKVMLEKFVQAYAKCSADSVGSN
ncbi:histidinol-phosphate transaminase [Nowakowskiella sp. JEL0407]|nr:histidinol-phosphate transaminase [Nowakowskiella sp. JEL0407]